MECCTFVKRKKVVKEKAKSQNLRTARGLDFAQKKDALIPVSSSGFLRLVLMQQF